MDAPLMGDFEVVVRAVRKVDIHDSHFLDVAYFLAADADQTEHLARIGPESVEGELTSGQRWMAQFAMRQITRMRPMTEQENHA